ncbi:MAG: beta-galactosidase, partial [Armatimonadota bacterium]
PPPSETTPERYAEIAEAGCNLVLGGGGVRDRDMSLRMLDMCRRANLKGLVLDGRAEGGKWSALDEIVRDYKGHPALYGLLLQDEPNSSSFAALGTTVRELRQKAPGLLGFINLFPNYATPAQLGCDSYEEYVSRFVSEVRPDVLCFDHYPLLRSGERDNFYENLEVVRREALKAKIPFWVIVQAEGIQGVYRSPSETEMAWQVWSALAYGASGILYFTYWTPPPGGGEVHFDGIISEDGRRRARYEWVKRLNRDLKRVGGWLLGKPSLAVYHSDPVPRGCSSVQKGRVLEGLEGGPALVGMFRVSTERTALFVVSRDFRRTVRVKLNLHDDVMSLKERLPDGTETKDLLRRELKFPALYEFDLEPGTARLFTAERERFRVRY